MKIKRFPVLGTQINSITWDDAILTIQNWAKNHESRYVCICNVHSVVSAARDVQFSKVINNADMATPDGAPIAWVLRHYGDKNQERINGPDLMWRYLKKAEELGQRPFFYGSDEATLNKLTASITHNFPRISIAGAYSPPFRKLTEQEDKAEIKLINQSGAHVVFVGLGCPKQERWMAAHCGQINAVMIGVGAAFDYHAGTLKRAPLSWQLHGFEWLYRLISEPRRLFKRYLITNTLFILGISKQFLVQAIKHK
jgi:N-acetylglucosaminyldiphosphoundecaprenol N-acetyl-beta-D-mannosaminyltransferase